MVNEYLTQASAFVYVIDTSRHGGVTKDRVRIEITLSFYFFLKQLPLLLPVTIFSTLRTQRLQANSSELG